MRNKEKGKIDLKKMNGVLKCDSEEKERVMNLWLLDPIFEV